MLMKCRAKLKILLARLRFIPKYYVFVPNLHLLAELFIRLSVGGTHIIYNALGQRGIFPGPFVYSLMFIIRSILSSIVLAHLLFSRTIYEERTKVVFFGLLSSFLILFEYKLIFGGVSLVLAIVFSLVAPLSGGLAVSLCRIKNKAITLSFFALLILQVILFIQLISLSVCI